MHTYSFTHDAYKEEYSKDEEFKVVLNSCKGKVVHDSDNTVDYRLQDRLLYRMDKLCVPKCE